MFIYKNLSLQKTAHLLVNQFFLFLNYNLFHIDIPFLYPLKIPENQRLFDVFREMER